MSVLRVSELARRSGVPASTLRYYDERGLLPAKRSDGGYRLYGEEALARLRFIRTAKELGLDLDAVADLVRLWERHPCSEVRDELRSRVTARLRAAQERVEEYERFQSSLRDALESLERPADTEKGCGADCPCVSHPETPPAGVVSLPLLSAGAAPSCSLGDTALTQRLERWRGLMVDAEPYPGPRGRVWPLPIEHAGAVAELAAAETACCPFLELRIDFTPETVRLHARLTPEVAPDLDGRTAEAVRWLTGGPDEDTEDARP